jgi:hypothetical protein
LEWDTNNCGANIRISDENKTITKISGGGVWNAGVLGNMPVNRYSIRLVKRGASGCIMIGFANKNEFKCNANNYNNKCGYYLYVRDGTINCKNTSGSSYTSSIIAEGTIIEAIFDSEKKQN